MADESRFVGHSIEELLVSLADGLREAQSALNDAPLFDSAGRPTVTYHLPYLDFTIQVDIETRNERGGGRPFALVFTRASTPATTSADARTVRSTVSGRLVATPPGEGLPTPRILISAAVTEPRKASLTLRVTNSAGERLAFQSVELNIDTAGGAALTMARGASPPAERLPGTRLQAAVVTTDAEGIATTVLDIDASEPPRGVVMVTATIGQVTSRVAVPVVGAP